MVTELQVIRAASTDATVNVPHLKSKCPALPRRAAPRLALPRPAQVHACVQRTKEGRLSPPFEGVSGAGRPAPEKRWSLERHPDTGDRSDTRVLGRPVRRIVPDQVRVKLHTGAERPGIAAHDRRM